MSENDFCFVYLCRDGANEELRYSIRSVLHFYPDAKIWVVGGKPNWYTGPFLRVEKGKDSHDSQRKNLAKIYESAEIPENIIVMNDDFFFVDRVEEFSYYCSGPLSKRIRQYKDNGIYSAYVNKLILLEEHCRKFFNDNPLDFELHVPMIAKKSQLGEVINEELMWRSNYGNRFIDDYPIKIMKDVKFYNQDKYAFKEYNYANGRHPFFSTLDSSFAEVKDFLVGFLPYPSKYEGDGSVRMRGLLSEAPKVSIFSSKNATWDGIGKIYRGHNLVTEEQAQKWLSRSFTRASTHEEAVAEFGPDYTKLKFDRFGKYNP